MSRGIDEKLSAGRKRGNNEGPCLISLESAPLTFASHIVFSHSVGEFGFFAYFSGKVHIMWQNCAVHDCIFGRVLAESGLHGST